MATIETVQQTGSPRVSCHRALQLAQADAEQAYRDLSAYRIIVVLEEDGWHVDYELAKPLMAGGGPHYIIDAVNGTILKKRYEQ